MASNGLVRVWSDVDRRLHWLETEPSGDAGDAVEGGGRERGRPGPVLRGQDPGLGRVEPGGRVLRGPG